MKWESNTGYICGSSDNYELNKTNKLKIASFDLDSTLIKTKSGKKFQENKDDWQWCYPNVKKVLNVCATKFDAIIIVSNQAGIKSDDTKLKDFKNKIEKIEYDLLSEYPDVSFQIYCALFHDVYRKPFPTLLENFKFDRSKSFYCGDAAGRPQDHSDCDIKFSYNLRIPFKTPENIFLNDKTSKGVLTYSIKPFNDDVINNKPYTLTDLKQNELIIMVGFPASGKSHTVKLLSEYLKMFCRKYEVISMDTLKTKIKMYKMINPAVTNNKTVIVDNTNLDIKTRTEIIDYVKKINSSYFVRILYVDTPIERCLHNNYYRCYTSYKTNHDTKLIPDCVYKMMQKNL